MAIDTHFEAYLQQRDWAHPKIEWVHIGDAWCSVFVSRMTYIKSNERNRRPLHIWWNKKCTRNAPSGRSFAAARQCCEAKLFKKKKWIICYSNGMKIQKCKQMRVSKTSKAHSSVMRSWYIGFPAGQVLRRKKTGMPNRLKIAHWEAFRVIERMEYVLSPTGDCKSE